MSQPAIRSVKARAIVVPLKRPVKNAFGIIEAAPLVLIDVTTDQGVTGRSYIFAYTKMTLKPLVELLGGSPRPIRAYDSYGVVDPTADERDQRRSLEQGFRGIKIKGGDGDAANDELALMLDFNQSLDPAEAARRIARLAPYDLTWIEEPVPQENLSGHAKVRASSPIPIQAGENWWFPRGFAEAIAAKASDFIMPDLMKVGGVTGWLNVAAQAEAASIPMSSHLFAEASAHMLAVTPTAHWLEVLDFAGAILANPIEIVDGTLTARGPGLGLEWSEAAVSKYLI